MGGRPTRRQAHPAEGDGGGKIRSEDMVADEGLVQRGCGVLDGNGRRRSTANFQIIPQNLLRAEIITKCSISSSRLSEPNE